MIGQLISSLVAGKGGNLPFSSGVISSATSGAGSRNKRINVNFTGKLNGDNEYVPGGTYFRSRAPVNYNAIALIGAMTIVAVFAVRK